MWAFRRELCLCSSRATCFLYFTCNVPETVEVLRIKKELGRLVEVLALPKNLNFGGARSSSLFIQETDSKDRRNLEVFSDSTSTASEKRSGRCAEKSTARRPDGKLVAPTKQPQPPMNALATDQAKRFAAAIFRGQTGATREKPVDHELIHAKWLRSPHSSPRTFP